MEASTTVVEPGSSDSGKDPREREAQHRAAGDEARAYVEGAALGAELEPHEERDALDWLLGVRPAMVHDIPVDWESPDGMRKLIFVVHQVDVRKIDEIENRHMNRSTMQMDRLSADCEVVAMATDAIIDKRSGRSVKVNSEEFLHVRRPDGSVVPHGAPPLALEDRFRDQLGLITNVGSEIRRLCGFTGERVGQAQRRMVRAALD